MTSLYLLLAILCSIAIIAWLWHGDPKRRRVAGLPAIGWQRRRLMTLAALLPGMALAVIGDSAAFLIWLGACAMGGWLVAQFRYRYDSQ